MSRYGTAAHGGKADLRTSTYMGANVEYNLDTPVGPLFCIEPEATSLRKVGEVTGVMLDVGGVSTVRA